MDLRLEKADLVRLVRPEVADPDPFHFDTPPTEADLERARDGEGALSARRTGLTSTRSPRSRRLRASRLSAWRSVPSLATKLLADPIAAVALAGRGVRAEDEPLVALAEGGLALAELAVHRSLRAQVEAGAAAVIVCEPAASALFVSPRQIASGSPVFDRFVLEPLCG